ncbi:LytS/YhcK type 5TM receptor domain-containing protein [Zavarzinia aquatilis]|nr:LytS/YhcK type 5TM receptor domain-containing protein [Zavarzinia aquatilis]
MNGYSAILSAGGITLILFVAFLAIDTLIAEHLPPERQKISRDIAIVALSATVMFFHVHEAEGVVLDQRGSAIAIATLFGGPVTGFLAMLVIGAIRILLAAPSSIPASPGSAPISWSA